MKTFHPLRFLFEDQRLSWFWLFVRLYVGYEWITAGWAKYTGTGWVGDGGGTALTGFVNGALQKATGVHPDVQSWYAWFLQTVVLPHAALWAQVVTFGEILVGVGLLLGALTGLAAFFGFFMNLNFLLAGSVSINPILLIFALLLVRARTSAGLLGIDGLLRRFGVFR